MYQTIQELSKKYFEQTKQTRRDLHKYAEKGWLEIRTACIIVEELEALGFHVLVGEQIMKKEARMGLPSYQIMHLNYRRAQKEIKNSKYIEKVKDGMTAVAGVYKNGDGPVIGLRFDIDALGLIEESSQDHFPFKEHFSSAILDLCTHVDTMGILQLDCLSQEYLWISKISFMER